MPEGGDTLLLAIEQLHHKKNCEELVKNMNEMISKNITSVKCDIIQTYGIPYINLDLCEISTPFGNLSKLGYKLEVNRYVKSNYDLEYIQTDKKFVIN